MTACCNKSREREAGASNAEVSLHKQKHALKVLQQFHVQQRREEKRSDNEADRNRYRWEVIDLPAPRYYQSIHFNRRYDKSTNETPFLLLFGPSASFSTTATDQYQYRSIRIKSKRIKIKEWREYQDKRKPTQTGFGRSTPSLSARAPNVSGPSAFSSTCS